eukprot:g2229.t1
MIQPFRRAAAWAAFTLAILSNEAGATSLRREVKRAPVCGFAEKEPLLSCDKLDKIAPGRSWNVNQHKAWDHLCQDSRTSPYMEVYLDRRFRKNYQQVYKEDGVFGKLTERLVDSIHRFSQHPIIVVNFGQQAPEELTAEKFPHLVLLHARGFEDALHISFNFNKLRAILLAQAKVGASLDSDSWWQVAQAAWG